VFDGPLPDRDMLDSRLLDCLADIRDEDAFPPEMNMDCMCLAFSQLSV